MSGIYRSLSSDWLRSLRSAGHRSWQIRQPAAQSKLRELRQRARSACFVPVIRKTQNNRDFTLSHFHPLEHARAGRTKKRKNLSIFPLSYQGAVGETRTRTGLLPLPPQSSVSTISPPPLCFGIAKVRHFFKPPNFFEIFFKNLLLQSWNGI